MEQSPDHIGVTIAEMAADHHDVPVDEMPPIAESIDPDALESMMNPERTDPQPDLYFSFTYASLQVQLRSDETVIVTSHRGERGNSVDPPPGDE